MSKVACKIPGEAKLTDITRRLSRLLDNGDWRGAPTLAIRVRAKYEPIVRQLLPHGAAIFLIGDTEFGPVEVLRQLDRWRWFYVRRLTNGQSFRVPMFSYQ